MGLKLPPEEPTCDSSHEHNGWCYRIHKCRCESCREAHRVNRRREYYAQKFRNGKLGTLISSAGTSRRLQALQTIGYRLEVISAGCGINSRNLANIARLRQQSVEIATYLKVKAFYDLNHMNAITGKQGSHPRKKAERLGFLPPLEWENIDAGVRYDPNSDE